MSRYARLCGAARLLLRVAARRVAYDIARCQSASSCMRNNRLVISATR